MPIGKKNQLLVTTYDNLSCEVNFLLKKDNTFQIQTINVIGDCVITFDDLDNEQKTFFLNEVKTHILKHKL